MTVPASAPPPPIPRAAAARQAELVAAILANDDPGRVLGETLALLGREQRPDLAAAVYEAVCYRVPVDDYWLHFRMWGVYHALGPSHDAAAYFHAAAAVRMQPDWSGSAQAFQDMFALLRRRGRDRDALDLFHYQMGFQPQLPAASEEELAELRQQLGLGSGPVVRPTSRPGACRLHEVMPEEQRPPWRCPTFGGGMPYSLGPLAAGMTRPAITVAEFADAELLICRDALVVQDRFGEVHEDFCVREHPTHIRDWILRREAAGESIEAHEAEDAVVICDEKAEANLCHALLNNLTRLALYQRAGVDTGRALVIGTESRINAQHEILRRAGVTAYLGTERIARVRARRLWVSSSCHRRAHAAQYGAAWAVEYVRRTLGGQGDKGWRRLYVSRADAPIRQVVNEAEVVALLEPHGFEVIVPGRMPYAAQLSAFRQASHVIAPHGAALAHVVLCPPGAQVLEMFHPLYGTSAYAMQAAAAGFNYAALVARDWDSDAPELNDPSRGDAWTARFLERHMRVDLPALSRYLATVL